MSRPNKRHNRALARHRRNKGPALFSRVADNQIEQQALPLVKGLCDATIKRGSAAAANLLLTLAEGAEWADDPVLLQRVLTMAEKWAREPQVASIELVQNPEVAPPPEQPQLTDGESAEAATSTALTAWADPASAPGNNPSRAEPGIARNTPE